jgi:chromosome segregation ATPase
MNEAEVQFYKEYISRLTHELLLCQGNSDKDWSRYEPKVELPPTLLAEKTLSPLFYSYDMRIEELRSVIEQQGTYLDLVTQRMNYLLDENQSFRNKQTDFLRVPTSNQERPVTLEEERLQGDNQLLIQQSDLLIEELRNVNSAISDREKTINGLSLDLEKKVELITQYEKKLELSEKKLRTAEHELSKEKRTVQTLKKQFNELLSNDSQRAALLHSTLMENKEYEVDVTDWSQRVSENESAYTMCTIFFHLICYIFDCWIVRS